MKKKTKCKIACGIAMTISSIVLIATIDKLLPDWVTVLHCFTFFIGLVLFVDGFILDKNPGVVV